MEDIFRRIKALEREVQQLRGTPIGEFTAWTPTVTQPSDITISASNAVYVSVGPLIYLSIFVQLGSAGTSGQHVTVSGLPAVIRPQITGSHFTIGNFTYYDAGNTTYAGSAVYVATNSVKFLTHNNSNYLGATPSFAVASGDELWVNCIYRWRLA